MTIVGWVRAMWSRRSRGETAPVGDPSVISLRDPSAASRLERDGYVRLGPFLDADEVVAANALFTEACGRLAEPLGDSWFPTILLEDDAVRAFISEGLGALIGPKLAEAFEPDSLEVVRLDFSVKPPTPTSELGPHQDYSLVDERRAQSLYLWIPLCDTDESNGTLHVVPGSHHFTNRIRSRHVPSYFDEALDLVHRAGVRLDCRAGELVAMVSGVIHYSPPNATGTLRLAAHGIVKPKNLPLVFYYADDQTPPGQVECYELDIDRYVQAIHQGRPGLDVAMARLEPSPDASMTRQRFRRGLAAHMVADRDRTRR